MSTASEIERYIAAADEPARGRLAELRALICAAAPEAEQRMSYGMPTWRQGENLVHIGAAAKHVGLYPGPAAIEAFAAELADWPTSKGAIRLPHDRPLPLALVERIVRWRVEQAAANVRAEADAKAAARAARRASKSR